jgi:hypothetical protein
VQQELLVLLVPLVILDTLALLVAQQILAQLDTPGTQGTQEQLVQVRLARLDTQGIRVAVVQ